MKVKIVSATNSDWYYKYVGMEFKVEPAFHEYRIVPFESIQPTFFVGCFIKKSDCRVVENDCDHSHILCVSASNNIDWCKKCGALKQTNFNGVTKWIKPNPKRNSEDILRDLILSCKTCVMFPSCEGCKCVKNTIKEIEALNGK